METATEPRRGYGVADGRPAAKASPLEGLQTLARNVAEAVMALFMLAIMLAFVVQVISRYIFNQPIVWTEELTLLLFPWTVFWGCCFLVPWKEHISFDIIYNTSPDVIKRIFLLTSSIIIAVGFIWVLPQTWDLVDFMWKRRTPMIEVRYFWIYICFAMFLVVMAVRAVMMIVSLLRREGWRNHV